MQELLLKMPSLKEVTYYFVASVLCYVVLVVYRIYLEKYWVKTTGRIINIELNDDEGIFYYDVVYKGDMGQEIQQRTNFRALYTSKRNINSRILNKEVALLFSKKNPQKIQMDSCEDLKKTAKHFVYITSAFLALLLYIANTQGLIF